MSFTQLTSDLNIIAALSDTPNETDGLTAAQLKAKFDEAANTIKTYLNSVHLAELEAEGGAGKIGIEAITGITALNVQEALEAIVELCNAISQGAVPDGSISTAKLAALAVTAEKLSELCVSTGKLTDACVTAAKIADGAVTAAKIADGGVTEAKLAAASVTGSKLSVGAVTTGKITDGNVTAAKLADGSVTEGKIANGAVTRAKMPAYLILGANDYGASLPAAGNPGRIFFKKL